MIQSSTMSKSLSNNGRVICLYVIPKIVFVIQYVSHLKLLTGLCFHIYPVFSIFLAFIIGVLQINLYKYFQSMESPGWNKFFKYIISNFIPFVYTLTIAKCIIKYIIMSYLYLFMLNNVISLFLFL